MDLALTLILCHLDLVVRVVLFCVSLTCHIHAHPISTNSTKVIIDATFFVLCLLKQGLDSISRYGNILKPLRYQIVQLPVTFGTGSFSYRLQKLPGFPSTSLIPNSASGPYVGTQY